MLVMTLPEKGKPDFSNLDEKRLRAYKDMMTDLMGCYQDCPVVYNALEVAWRDLSDACLEIVCSEPDSSNKDKEPLTLTRKKLVHSPLSLKRKKIRLDNK